MVTVADAADLPRVEEVVSRGSDEVHVDVPARRITAKASGLHDMLGIGEAVAATGVPIDDLGLQRPSLDDVFLHLTGHRAETTEDEGDEALEEATR